MRGDQLVRQWRVIRAIEARSKGLIVAEIAKREETGIRTIYRDRAAEHDHAHAKAQRAPRKTSRVLSAYLKIFLLPSYFFKERIKEFSVRVPLRPLRLAVRGLDDFMRQSFKVMHDELYTVKVRISPDWARWVGEKIWHESKEITRLLDGGLEITFPVAGLDEIKRWVLSFGPEAQVLEPLSLRQMVRADLQKSLAQYSGHRVSYEMAERQAIRRVS